MTLISKSFFRKPSLGQSSSKLLAGLHRFQFEHWKPSVSLYLVWDLCVHKCNNIKGSNRSDGDGMSTLLSAMPLRV
jgi:hypothetical protein